MPCLKAQNSECVTCPFNSENCTGGDGAFGGAGTASGVFINCTGDLYSFAATGIASGMFINCTGGFRSFGGGVGGTASGLFRNCIGGNLAFGSTFGSAPAADSFIASALLRASP